MLLMSRTHRSLITAVLVIMMPGLANAATWAQYWQNLDHAAYVQVGNGPVLVYDFFDPNCAYCLTPYKMEQSYIQSGKLTVRYIPVGFLTGSSFGKAAAILQARNPQWALAVDMRGIAESGKGGIAPLMPTSATRYGLQRNQALLEQSGVDIVPDLVFRLPDGHVGMIKGVFPGYAMESIAAGRMP